MFLFRSDLFLQFIEEKKDKLEKLYSKITQGKRHLNIKPKENLS